MSLPTRLEAVARRLGLDADLPYDPLWSAAPDFLERIVEHVLAVRPTRIVECGCGVSTLLLARACALNERGQVTSLEQTPEFAAATRAALAARDLAPWADVLDAPLVQHPGATAALTWYTLDRLPDATIDLLVIDGPPGRLGRHARYPALPLLHARLARGGAVFLDDAARQEEQEIAAMWRAAYPGMRYAALPLERGCAFFEMEA